MGVTTSGFSLFYYATTGTDLGVTFDLARSVSNNFINIESRAMNKIVGNTITAPIFSTAAISTTAILFGGSIQGSGLTISSATITRVVSTNNIVSTGSATIGGVSNQNNVNSVFQVLGTTRSSSGANFSIFSANTNPTVLIFGKSRNPTIGSHTIVGSADTIADFSFNGSDGTKMIEATRIRSSVDGTPGTSIMPGRIQFYTTSAGDSSPIERMRIASSGFVGISTTNPSVELHVGGNTRVTALSGSGNRAVYSDSNGNLTNSSSDERLKTNINLLSDNLQKIQKLRPVQFNWIETEKLGSQNEIGFIAQEVEKIIPEVIGENNDRMKSIDYAKIVAVLSGAIQEQQKIIESLDQRIKNLENK